jgi:aerobic-type carbon monoxide dehydrogenase small subunit (CoxS/CutS family)
LASFRLVINGKSRKIEAEPATPLLWILRNNLDLTGTKYGCGEGQCGACTVLVGGQAVRSCVLPVSAVKARPIVTIEGLERDGRLHPVQEAFLKMSAFQCGYCTPGMIVASAALLDKKPKPTEQEIREHLEGNICRCGTYPRIVQAVRLAAQGDRHG